MKLLSVQQARSVWLFNLNDLNPRGKAIERDALKEIGSRYQFSTIPDLKALLDARENNKPVIFPDGIFKHGDDEIGVALLMYRDGFIADTRSSTVACDAFLHDLLTWISEEFLLVHYEKVIRKKVYVSELYLRFEKSLNLVNPVFAKICEFLTNKGYRAGTTPIELGVLQFWEDMPSTAQLNFRLERAVGSPFSEQRFFSSSALSTDDHLALLELCERELLGA